MSEKKDPIQNEVKTSISQVIAAKWINVSLSNEFIAKQNPNDFTPKDVYVTEKGENGEYESQKLS